MALNNLPIFAKLWRNRGLSQDELTAVQQERLRWILSHAYQNVPYYHELLRAAGIEPEAIRTLEDLKCLPVTRKRDLQSRPLEQVVAGNVNKAGCLVRRTGGSTGEPLAVYTRREDLNYEALVWLRTWLWLGLKPTDLQVTIKDPSEWNLSGRREWLQRLGLFRVRYLDIYQSPERLLDQLSELRPDVLRAPPSVLDILAGALEGSSRKIKPRLVFTAGEQLAPEPRRRIEGAFSAVVHDCYGATEAGCIGWRCPDCSAYHLNADSVIVEVLRDGIPTAPGQAGEVVITNLSSRAMPFIRYSLGDLGILDEVPSRRCGIGSLSLRNLLGRTFNPIVLPGGGRLSPYALIPDDVTGIAQYRVFQPSPDWIRILIVKGEGYHDGIPDHLKREFFRGLEADRPDLQTALPLRLTVEAVSEIPISENGMAHSVARGNDSCRAD